LRIKTVPAIVKQIKKIDPSSAISESFLFALIKENLIPFTHHGNRMVIDGDSIVFTLNELLGFKGSTTLPHIRTIRKAVEELKEQNFEIGIGEKLIRKAVKDKRISCIRIGNREYISMQSFEEPYCSRIFSPTPSRSSRAEIVRNDLMEQISRAISTNPLIPTVKRIHKVG
jgi:hypothetical protein